MRELLNIWIQNCLFFRVSIGVLKIHPFFENFKNHTCRTKLNLEDHFSNKRVILEVMVAITNL